jgi:hypothetical protein
VLPDTTTDGFDKVYTTIIAGVDTTVALVFVEAQVVPLATTVAVATLPATPLVKLIELPDAVVPLGNVQ